MTTVDTQLDTVDRRKTTVDCGSEVGGAQGVPPPPGPAQVSASRLVGVPTSFGPAWTRRG
jgi:hypothetical protein